MRRVGMVNSVGKKTDRVGVGGWRVRRGDPIKTNDKEPAPTLPKTPRDVPRGLSTPGQTTGAAGS
jgi:hypothetical protein